MGFVTGLDKPDISRLLTDMTSSLVETRLSPADIFPTTVPSLQYFNKDCYRTKSMKYLAMLVSNNNSF